MQYEFTVTAFDGLSGTNSSISCLMYSSGPKDSIIDVTIEGEATNTGFINFSRKQTAFKSAITNLGVAKVANLKYTWWISDSNGNLFTSNQVEIYQNSIGVSTNLMNRNSLYTVYVQITDGVSWGNASQTLRTLPQVSNEFYLEPSSLDPMPLSTIFSLTVFNQDTYDNLNQYVFGYINPSDGVTKIPMTQKSYMKFR